MLTVNKKNLRRQEQTTFSDTFVAGTLRVNFSYLMEKWKSDHSRIQRGEGGGGIPHSGKSHSLLSENLIPSDFFFIFNFACLFGLLVTLAYSLDPNQAMSGLIWIKTVFTLFFGIPRVFFGPFWRPIFGHVPNAKKYVFFPNLNKKIPNSRNKNTGEKITKYRHFTMFMFVVERAGLNSPNDTREITKYCKLPNGNVPLRQFSRIYSRRCRGVCNKHTWFISSPEPKAHGWANSIPVTPASVRRPSVRPQFQTSSPLKPKGQLNSNFIWRLRRTREWKFVQMVLVTWPRWPPRPYKVKTL